MGFIIGVIGILFLLHVVIVAIKTFVVIYFVQKNFSKKLDYWSTFLLLIIFGDPRQLMK